ncbi:MAG TPA: YihY/virulence factor BrkB family protein [Pseudolabrys sp.]|nr:YihY/virulence factor BrkB family protein [Pseudolabrys sp.]
MHGPPRQTHDQQRVRLWHPLVTTVLLIVGYRPANYAAPTVGGTASAARFLSVERLNTSGDAQHGWKQQLVRIYNEISNDRVVALAAGVTFYSILALFPAMAALVSLYGLFADPASISNQLDNLRGVLPDGAMEVIGGELNRLVAQGRGQLGAAFVGGLLIALWSANAGIKALFDALNLVYDEPEKRGFIKLNAVSLTFTTGIIVFVLVALAGMIVLPAVINAMGSSFPGAILIDLLRWPALLVIAALGLALLYRFGASRSAPRWKWITWGSAFAAVAWLIVSLLFTWYAANFGSYNKTYGSLGAIIGFMVWIWLSGIVVLIGAEIDSVLEQREENTP